jgi:hypothetical protein
MCTTFKDLEMGMVPWSFGGPMRSQGILFSEVLGTEITRERRRYLTYE